MMSSLRRNAVWNISEVLISSLVLFVLYKLILARLGVPSLGVWSLVLATTSLARLADIGAAGGLGRYVALAQSKESGDAESLLYVETALITNGLLYLVLAALLYWPAWTALALVTHGQATLEARGLLPYAMASFTLMNISNVVVAALIGLGRSYQKSMIVLATLMLQLLVAALLIERLGLRAIAVAQLVQFALLTALGWFLVLRAVKSPRLFALPYRFSKPALREIVGFGLRLQVLNIASFPFELITKFVFSSVGGLNALGIYELASRGFLQVRQIVVAPSQNLTPLFAAQHQMDPSRLKPLYERAAIVMISSGALTMAILGLGSPIISLLWLGRVDRLFVVYSALLALGWFCNIASTPGYYLGIGAGRLRWNIVGAIVTTSMTGVIGLLLGGPLGPVAVAGGSMFAIAFGSLLTWSLNCRDLGLSVVPARGEWRAAWLAMMARPRDLLRLKTNNA